MQHGPELYLREHHSQECVGPNLSIYQFNQFNQFIKSLVEVNQALFSLISP